MPSQFHEWVALLKEDGQGGLRLPVMHKGQPYAAVLTYAADFSGDTFTAYADISPNTGSDGTPFAVSVGSFSGGGTEVTISLTKSQVNALASDDDADGVSWAVYEVNRTPSGSSNAEPAGAGEIAVLEAVY